MSTDPTYPHDYRIIAGSAARPTIVGGQAVNLWAITFLESGDVALSTKYASGDLDVLSSPAVLAFLNGLGPPWRVDRIPFWAFGDGRDAIVRSVAPDNRRLLVEVIKTVHGLDARELEAVEELDYGGVVYRVLDPIVLLKAKAANVRDLNQSGPPERHNRQHLQLIARCWPHYLEKVHAITVEKAETHAAAAKIFSRAFSVLQHRLTAATLVSEGIAPASLLPVTAAKSPVEKIRNAYRWQLPRLR